MPSSLSYRLFPAEGNKLVVRFDNLKDKFDSKSGSSVNFNLKSFSESLYSSINGHKPGSV